jgi:hypothetical protein
MSSQGVMAGEQANNSTYGREERYILGFGGKTLEKITTRKAQAQMGG